MVIEDGKVVSIAYTLTNDAGEKLDTSEGGDPLQYLHGAQNIVPGLEKALTGKSAGDTFDVRVSPEEGYGPRTGESQQVPRSQFPEGMPLQVGMPLRAEVPEHGPVVLWIERIETDTVHVSLNHPLAGEHLNFAIEVVDVREATAEEQSHGHVHGPGGHHH